VYSCPLNSGDNRCHLSLVVKDRDGRQYVLDNGAVLTDAHGAGGVASLAAFTPLVETDYRLVAKASESRMPDEQDAAHGAATAR
jgi:hypothetical protein